VKPWFPNTTLVQKFHLFLATGFGSGFSPVVSGTAGSAVAVILYYFFHPLLSRVENWPWGLLFLLLFLSYSFWSAEVAERYYKKKDDGRVVIDEFIGQWIALYLIPMTLWTPLAAFFLFRFFDIAKPFPARRLQYLRGGLGIVIDDVFAGIYANLVLQLFLWMTPMFFA
jgi:phosphatidylglycerophosphatase A